MQLVNYSTFLHLNESISKNILKNGTVLVYSYDGSKNNYNFYVSITNSKDLEKCADKLKWVDEVTDDDKNKIKKSNGIIVTSKGDKCAFEFIADIYITNILRVYDTDLSYGDMFKDGKIADVEEKCTDKNLAYEKDVDYADINQQLAEPMPFRYLLPFHY